MDRDSQIIRDRLTYLYPNKIVQALSLKDRPFYSVIYGYLKEKYPEVSIGEYIRSLGFEYIGKTTSYNVLGEFDFRSMHYLIGHYEDINQTVIAQLLGISRQRVSQRLNEATQGGRDWRVSLFTDEERIIVKSMVDEELFVFEYDDNSIAILTAAQIGPVFILRNTDSIRIHFDFDLETLQLLASKNRDRFSEVNYVHSHTFEKVNVGGQMVFREKSGKSSLNIKQYCSARGLDYGEYLRNLGIHPTIDGRVLTDEDWFDRLLPYVESDGVLRVPHQSGVQSGLAWRAKVLGMSGQEYAEMLGFQWRQRDFASEHEKRMLRYERLVKEQSFEGFVYLPSEEGLYRSLYSFLRGRNETLHIFLERIGLERLDKDEYQSRFGITGAILDKLKELQSTPQYEINPTARIMRNKKMVTLLKKLYDYHCQICGMDNPLVPRIEKDDGTYYCEVHHVTPLGTAEAASDIETLDHYSNAICLCSFHHSYVHYHQGGAFQISLDGNQIFLLSTLGEKLPIQINKHISFHIKEN
ncbi:HNH endonuclease domain-containing protein [Paenibacillus sp. FSL R7-269]|uniref:HNH endonuclease n=1 Tax=Paenibacillus sp. FSL R7-269 TaxID=1226755 RepID=UPI0003E27DD9|nr:HNH endonuclease [Paenibacillus sp. FSL R7-269]ETT49747.1 HNH endonuclease domain-containing protein [Paenibacillus sp. FSL R7-269]